MLHFSEGIQAARASNEHINQSLLQVCQEKKHQRDDPERFRFIVVAFAFFENYPNQSSFLWYVSNLSVATKIFLKSSVGFVPNFAAWSDIKYQVLVQYRAERSI